MIVRLAATLNESAFTRLCNELVLTTVPTVKIEVRGGRGKVLGTYTPSENLIHIYLDFDMYEADALRFVTTEVNRTLLHETRHAWQWETKRWVNGVEWRENDAEEYANRKSAEYRDLVRVRRVFHRTGMSKLNTAEKRARNT